MADQEKETDRNSTNNDENKETKTENVPPNYENLNSVFYTQYPSNNYVQNVPNGELQYKNAREYAQVLHCWLWQYRMAAAFSVFQSQMLSSVAQNATAVHNTRVTQVHSAHGQQHSDITNGGETNGPGE